MPSSSQCQSAEIARRFVVLTSGRSGSNWLCSLLDSHSDLVCHRELFNAEGVHWSPSVAKEATAHWNTSDLVRVRDRDPQRFMYQAFRLERRHRAVGFKLCPDHPTAVWDAVFADPFISKVFLRRRNRVKCFVSRRLAELTGEWESFDHVALSERQHTLKVEPHDLLTFAEKLNTFDRALHQRLAATAEQACCLTYEALSDERQHVLEMTKLFAFLDVKTGDMTRVPTTRKQNSSDLRAIIENFSEIGTKYYF